MCLSHVSLCSIGASCLVGKLRQSSCKRILCRFQLITGWLKFLDKLGLKPLLIPQILCLWLHSPIEHSSRRVNMMREAFFLSTSFWYYSGVHVVQKEALKPSLIFVGDILNFALRISSKPGSSSINWHRSCAHNRVQTSMLFQATRDSKWVWIVWVISLITCM